MALTPKQQVFIDEYLKHFNATKAATDAGYSPKTAHAIGWENLRKPEIAEIISQRLAETAMGPGEVLMRLAEHARSDMGDFLNVAPDGETSFDLTGKSNTRLIKKMTQKRTIRRSEKAEIEEVVLSIELHDPQAALVHIGKHHGLFKDIIESKSEIDVNVDEATERLISRIDSLSARLRPDEDAGRASTDE